MYITLYIKTLDYDKAKDTVNNVLSNISQEYIKNINFKLEPYWKFDDLLVADIELKLNNELDAPTREKFLYSISNNWIFHRHDKSEALSSETMEACQLKYNLEMISVDFIN